MLEIVGDYWKNLGPLVANFFLVFRKVVMGNMLNSLFRQALSFIWGHVYAPKTGMCMYRIGM